MSRHAPCLVSTIDDAERELTRGLALLAAGALDDADLALERAAHCDTLFSRASRARGVVALKLGRQEQALVHFVDGRARAAACAHALAADLDHRVAHVAHTLCRDALAERAYRACLARSEDATLRARARHNLAVLLIELARLDEAERLLHRALAERERVFGLGSREVAKTLRELAVVARERGHDDEARAFYERALFALGHAERSARARYLSELSRLVRRRRAPSPAVASASTRARQLT